MKTLTTSEFVALIKTRLPEGWVNPFRGDAVSTVTAVYRNIPGRGCGMDCLIHVFESEKGCSRVTVAEKRYSQMNAAEKREAVELFNSLKIEKVVYTTVCHTPTHGDIISKHIEYWAEGDFARANAARNELNRIPAADIQSIELV